MGGEGITNLKTLSFHLHMACVVTDFPIFIVNYLEIDNFFIKINKTFWFFIHIVLNLT